MKPILFGIIPLILMGCADTKTIPLEKYKLQRIEISSELLDCKDKRVSIPDTNKLTNAKVGRYIIESSRLLNECRSDAKTVSDIINDQNIRVDEFNRGVQK